MSNVFPADVISRLRERRKHDCQGERPEAPKPGRNSVWGRNMLKTVFEAIEHDEGLPAALDAFRQKINEYDQNEVA